MKGQGVQRLADDYLRIVCHFHTLRQPDGSLLDLDDELDPLGGLVGALFVATIAERVQLIAKHLNLLFLLRLKLLQAVGTGVFVFDQRRLQLLEQADLRFWRNLPFLIEGIVADHGLRI